jgi:hypothetical protein
VLVMVPRRNRFSVKEKDGVQPILLVRNGIR